MEQEEQRFLNENVDNCLTLYHRVNTKLYGHLGKVNDRNFSLCVLRRKWE